MSCKRPDAALRSQAGSAAKGSSSSRAFAKLETFSLSLCGEARAPALRCKGNRRASLGSNIKIKTVRIPYFREWVV